MNTRPIEMQSSFNLKLIQFPHVYMLFHIIMLYKKLGFL